MFYELAYLIIAILIISIIIIVPCILESRVFKPLDNKGLLPFNNHIIPKPEHNKTTKWGWIVLYPKNLKLGKNTDIGYGTIIQAKNGITISDNVQIGAHCAIYSENTIDGTKSRIIIEDNVCIGAGSIILPNKDGTPLIIKESTKIGALSLVKKSINESGLYTGIPVKKYNVNFKLLESSYE